MHWCIQETEALFMFLSALPLVGLFFKQLHTKWHERFKTLCDKIGFHHKGHDKCCNKENVK
jgi:hypothetical protein